MSTVTVDYIKDLMNICKNGNLLITYYRDYDMERERIKELFEYIDENKQKDYNWIKINVTDCPEICAILGVYSPCTVLYKNNGKRYNFGSYASGYDITYTTKHIDEYPIITNDIYTRTEVTNE